MVIVLYGYKLSGGKTFSVEFLPYKICLFNPVTISANYLYHWVCGKIGLTAGHVRCGVRKTASSEIFD